MTQLLVTVVIISMLVGTFSTLIVLRSRSFDVSSTWPLLAFFLPLLVALVDFKLNILPVFPDARLYDQLAWDTVLAWRRGDLLPASFHNVRTQGYASIVAIVYFFSGRIPLLAIVLNTAIWGLTVCYWLRLNKEVFNIHSEAFGVLLILYPSGIIYAASFLREAVMGLFLAITLLHFSRWIQHKKIRNFLVGGISFGLLAVIRPETLPLLLISGSFALVFDLFGWLSRIKKYGILTVTSLSVVILFLLFDVSGYYNPFRVDFLETKRQNLAQYPFSYLETLSYESWFDVILYLPIRVFHFLFQPFPWYPSNYHLTFATIDALFLVMVVPLFVLGIIRYRPKLSAEHIFLLTFAGLSIIGYALVVSTKGAVTRRRLLAMPIMLIFTNLVLPRIRIVSQSLRT